MRFRLAIPLLSIALAAAPAWAQEAVVEGPGYPLGEGTVVHPSVAAETAFISNVFYEDQSSIAAPVIRVLASAAISSENNRRAGTVEPVAESADEDQAKAAPTLDFRLSGRLGYEQYVHTNVSVTEQSNLSAGLNGHLEVLPASQVSFLLDNDFVRDTRPRNFESPGDLNRDINRLRLAGRYRPGNGALELRLGLENTLDRFESSGSAFANRLQTLLRARAEWQFLPITRFFFDTSYGFFGGLGGGSTKVASNPLRIQLGAATAITEITTVRSHIGFGKGFYASGPEFTNVLFGTELGLRYSPVGRFTVAYDYGFEDSINANFYTDHAIVAKVDQQIETVLLDAGAQLRLRTYQGVLLMETDGAETRNDLILRVYGRGNYLYRDWLAFSGSVDVVTDQTEFTSMTETGTDNPSYTRVDVSVGVTAAF